MPARPVGVTDTATAVGVAEIDVIERASPDIFTTTTADPSTGGTSLAVTLRDRFPQVGSFKIQVMGTSGLREIMLVTAGQGTGAGSFTVTRAQDGTTAVAHSIGARVSQMVGVQRVENTVAAQQVSYRGRASTFKTLGRAGTTGQKIFAIHNDPASTVLVDVNKVLVDVMQTTARVVEPPLVRLWKFTAVPTNGSPVTKVPEDSALTSSSSVTVWQDSSADNTGSATTLTITLPGGTIVSQSWGARALTLVGYEQFDREIFFENEDENPTLRAGEGLAVFLDYLVATANPITDKWAVGIRWTEYTAA
jgi:hypothetical protein